MNTGLLTLLGVLGAALITGGVPWLIARRTRPERDAGIIKTIAESDSGVAKAAETIMASITRDYQRLSAELEIMRQDVTLLRAELAVCDADRITTAAEMSAMNAENMRLRKRVDDLETIVKGATPVTTPTNQI